MMRYCLLVLTISALIGTSGFAQKPERPHPFHADTASPHRPAFRPMKFPEQNLHPDPTVINDQAILNRGVAGMEYMIDTALIRLAADLVKGDPGVFGRFSATEGEFSTRAFTPMAVATNITSYPASTAVRLELHFPNYDSQCSGVLIDARHVLTAGHCVYDIDDDEWAESIGVAPAYDYGPDVFFGTATSYNMLSWTGWTQNGLWEHDLAVIELDRPVGALAGWCGYGYNTSNAYFTGQTFHNYSYPGDPPYNGEVMYYRHGNFDTPHTNILYHNNDSWGGQSGSGAPDEDEIAYSALSHSYTNGSATGHTRITSTKFDQIQEFIDENTPDETDFVAMRADASHDIIGAGEWLGAIYFLIYNNSEQGYTGNLQVNYYLSEDDYVGTSDDILIGNWSVWVDDLGPKEAQWITFDYATQIPPETFPGNYFIGAHVTNADVNSLNNYTDYQDAFPILITCGFPEPPLLNIAGSLIKCEDAVVNLGVSNICTGCEVIWSTGETGPSISVTEGGVYYANMFNSCGNFSDNSDIVIVENIPNPEQPDIEVGGSTLLCDGDFLTLTVTNPCPDCWIEWADGQTGESIVVTEDGVYTAFQANVCAQSPDADPVFVDTDETPSAPGITADGPTALCNGESVTLIATDICQGCVVEWSTGQTGINITVNAPGNYSAILINDCGESVSSNVVAVTQGNAPATPVVNASGPTSLCAGQHVTLSVTNVCAGCSVEWSNGQTGNSIQVSVAGTYTAILSNTCGSSIVSNGIQVTVEADFVPMVQVNNTCQLAAPNGSHYQWRLNGIDISGANGQFLTVAEDGYYSVRMRNSAGCEGVSDPLFAEACVTSTSRLLEPSGLHLYPNPTSGRVYLEWRSGFPLNDFRLDVFAPDGRYLGPVWSQDVVDGGSVTEIALPAWSPGLYIYRLTSREGHIHGRLVIQ